METFLRFLNFIGKRNEPMAAVIKTYKENEYKLKYPFEKRFNEIEKIHDLHPDKIPIYTLPNGNFKIKKVKYLVFGDLKVYQFINVIKKNIDHDLKNGDYNKEVYLQIDGERVMLELLDNFGNLYDKYKDKDGFLYLSVSIITNYLERIDNKNVEPLDQIESTDYIELHPKNKEQDISEKI